MLTAWGAASRRLPVWAPAGLLFGGLLAVCSLCFQPRAVRAADERDRETSTAPAGLRDFAPGVRIDWAQRAVHVETHVVLRQGPLEFLACFGGREHESILRFDASAVHIYQALGLVGVEAGTPAPLDPATSLAARRPTGGLVTLEVRWAPQSATAPDGAPRTVEAFDWLEEVEYQRPPLARPWVFAGSQVLPGGALLADKSGAGVALVDFDDSLIALSRSYTSRNSALWVAARTAEIPAVGTAVTMIIRAAAPKEPTAPGRGGSSRAADGQPAEVLDVRIDGLAQAYVNGRWCSDADLIDLLRLQQQMDPPRVTTIRARGLLSADKLALQRGLSTAGLRGGYTLERTDAHQ